MQKEFQIKLATKITLNIKAVGKYVNYKTKNREGASDLYLNDISGCT